MTFRVILLPRAAADIESNARWWAEHHSVEQTTRWFDSIYEQLLSLSEFPESHSPSAENGDFPYQIRDKLLGLGSRPSHRAVFAVWDETVYVLTIRSVSQDRLLLDQVDAPPTTENDA